MTRNPRTPPPGYQSLKIDHWITEGATPVALRADAARFDSVLAQVLQQQVSDHQLASMIAATGLDHSAAQEAAASLNRNQRVVIKALEEARDARYGMAEELERLAGAN